MVLSERAGRYGRVVVSERMIEAVLAGSVGAITLIGVASEVGSAGTAYPYALGAYLLGAVAAVPLVARRRRPGLVALAVALVVLAYHLAGYPGLAPALVFFVAVYSLAAYGSGWPALAGCLGVAAAAWVIPTLPPHGIHPLSIAIVAPALAQGWMIVLGVAARQRRRAAQERIDRVTAAATAELGQRIAEERLRIARDLHDVLAHTVAVIAVHAGVALEAIDDDPAGARTALERVRAGARQALPQLRAAVGPLRTDPVPALGLADLEPLLEEVRATGLRVDYAGLPPEAVGPEVGLTIYRVVQEALTNVVRHARATTARVALDRVDDAVVVSVHDDGPGGPGPTAGAPAEPGFGLVGMRERVHALGGTLETGPAPGHGFQVLARIPA